MPVIEASRRLAAHLGALRIGPELLAAGRPGGDLDGVETVVKDLIDVAGGRTGAGNPEWLDDARPAAAHAPAVARLVDAGAAVVGKSHTDELAFSLSGTNVHYGTPRNPAAPGRVPGGSSSGSASAVAGGLVPVALGTDTGGSIRVPASYCGVFGLRPTHGRVPLGGVVELAPSFDTVGLLAATGRTLRLAGRALLGSSPATPPAALVLATDLADTADAPVTAAVREATTALGRDLGIRVVEGELQHGALAGWLDAFRGRQMVEAWRSHGPWITERRPALGPGVAERFAQARLTPPEAAAAAGPAGDDVRRALDALLPPGAAMVLPSAATVAPPIGLTGDSKADLRRRTLMLTCVAGLAGLPAVSLPLARVGGLPVGVCVIGRQGDDDNLLDLAAEVSG